MQTSLKTSPAFLNYGCHPRPVKSLRSELEKKELVLRLDPEVWKERVTRLDALKHLVAKYIDESHPKQSGYYNRGKKMVEYAVGDKVMRRVHVLSNATQGFSAKLAPKYEGPYEITAKLAPTVYLLEMEGSRRNRKVHVGELMRYLPPRRVIN